jgi:hypothetical protein
MKPILYYLMTNACIFCFFFSGAQSRLQQPAGLFKTAADYRKGLVSQELPCVPGTRTIKTDRLFHGSEISIQESGRKKTYPKGEYYGYRDCQGKAFRFVNNQDYEILDSSGLFLYAHRGLAPGKGYHIVTSYFFSAGSGDPIQPFSLANLLAAFPEDVRFHYALQSYAVTQEALLDFDPYVGTHKVNYLFKESLK